MPLRPQSAAASFIRMTRSINNVWLHRFACALAMATLFLVGLGGVVTTKGVGMAVPDWPTTYGENMFLFPPSKWIGGVFYEHSHRLVASLVGMLTIVLMVWLWLKESRRWLRWVGAIALVAVIFQGVLGGLRVVFDEHGLGTEFGIFHAAFAQLFFLLTCSVAVFTSRWWTSSQSRELTSPAALAVRRWFVATSFLILIQIIFGATMRHQHAGLAVPDFPLAYGKVWPPTDAASVQFYNAHRLEAAGEQPITAPHIIIHMLHRFLGMALLVAIVGCVIATWKRTAPGSLLRKVAGLWAALSVVQVTLGILSILSHRKVDVTTAHVALGALTFAVGWMLVLIATRCVVEPAPAQARKTSLSPSADLKHA
jgi:cytochrome c oxidase assembly protein subunit 15